MNRDYFWSKNLTKLPSTASLSDYLNSEADFRRFVQVIIILSGVAALIALVGILLSPTLKLGRAINVGVYAVVFIYSWYGLRRSAATSVARFTVGLWLLSTLSLGLYAGVHSINVVAYPSLIAFAALVLGKRWLVGMTFATIAAILSLGVAEYMGYFSPTPRVPALYAAVTISMVILVVSVLVYAAYLRFATSRKKIVELNDSLERKVAERTIALESALEELQRSRDDLVRSEAQATISTLVASVSHELNTPLGLALTVATTLVERSKQFQKLVAENQLRRTELVEFVDRTCDGNDLMQRNLVRAVELMKNFRQVAIDQASEQYREFDLLDVVQEVLATMSPMLKRTSHKIVVEIPGGIILRSYPGPLGQVIINLVNNAYIHAFEGRNDGVLTIKAQTMPDDQVQMTIADNGVGMTPLVQSHLFDLFFSTKMGEGGTGLGMSIVKNLVTVALRGKLELESTPGVGSRFMITLPRVVPVN
jgi:signal transduction histidine kinase